MVFGLYSSTTTMIALSTGSLYSYSIERVFALAREAGFDGIEVIVDQRWETRQADYLCSLSSAHVLPILSIHSPFVLGIDGWENDPVQSVQRSMELAHGVGAHLVVAHLPFRWHWLAVSGTLLSSRHVFPLPWPWGQAYDRWLLQTTDTASPLDDVRIAVENMPTRRLLGLRWNPYRFNHPEEMQRFSALVLDTTHLATWGLNILAAYEYLRPRIAHLHLSDYDGREHRLPGQGRLPLAELLRRMSADGYRGIVVVEACPQAFGAGDDRQVCQKLRETLSFCRGHFADTFV